MIKNKVKKLIQKNRKIYKIFELLNFLFKSRILPVNCLKKKYPTVLQFPITFKCNAKCEMCNVWNMENNNEIGINELQSILSDSIFNKIKSVGISGGEPTLISNLSDYVRIMIEKLPNLESIYLITNGFNTNRILEQCRNIYKITKQNNVYFHISISLDGYGHIHDKIRNVPGVFKKTLKTILEIKNNLRLYADSYNSECTVVKSNANYLSELKSFSDKNHFNLSFRLGIKNKRIGSDTLFPYFNSHDDFSTREFFFKLSYESKILQDRFKYFSIFYFLTYKRKRLLGCLWQNDGITLDSFGDIFYCATESEKIGNILDGNGVDQYFKRKNLLYRKKIKMEKCNGCIHDYVGVPSLFSIIIFLKYFGKLRFINLYYKALGCF